MSEPETEHQKSKLMKNYFVLPFSLPCLPSPAPFQLVMLFSTSETIRNAEGTLARDFFPFFYHFDSIVNTLNVQHGTRKLPAGVRTEISFRIRVQHYVNSLDAKKTHNLELIP